MLSIIISIGLGGVLGILVFQYTGFSVVWGVVAGTTLFLTLQVLLGLLIRKVVKKRTNDIQNVILGGQEKLNRKIQFFQQKPKGGMKTMQRLLEKDQQVFIREALEKTKCMESLYSWNILLKKQVSTMRMQFYYQLKEFDKVDQLIPKAMYVDSMSVAMKMARQYKNKDPKYKKTFYKKVKKYKTENATILYAAYSWMLVKRGEIEEAIKVLLKGKKVTDNEAIAKNWEHLVNGRLKKFSNADIGDQWYSLYLEEPKATKPKQKVMRRQQY